MTVSVVRLWLAFTAFGIGMIHLALVVSAPLPIAIALAGLGAAELGWGILALVREPLPVARAAAGMAALGALAPLSLVLVSVLSPSAALGASLPTVPIALAAVLQVLAVALIALDVRRGHGFPTAPAGSPQRRVVRSLLAAAFGALVVGGLTTPALAATEAGRYAQPHGEHVVVDPSPAPTGSPTSAADRPTGHVGH